MSPRRCRVSWEAAYRCNQPLWDLRPCLGAAGLVDHEGQRIFVDAFTRVAVDCELGDVSLDDGDRLVLVFGSDAHERQKVAIHHRTRGGSHFRLVGGPFDADVARRFEELTNVLIVAERKRTHWALPGFWSSRWGEQLPQRGADMPRIALDALPACEDKPSVRDQQSPNGGEGRRGFVKEHDAELTDGQVEGRTV